MYAKEIKLAEKLIRKKQERDGILLLMKTLIKFNDSETYIKKEYQTAGQLFASLLPVKHYRTIIFEFTKEVSQTSIIYLINIAVQFGQLKAAIIALEERFSLAEMELETVNFYLDILDSFMEREKALLVAKDYLNIHHSLQLGDVTTRDLLLAWESRVGCDITGQPATTESDIEFFTLLFKVVKIHYCEGNLSEARALVMTL